MEHTVSTGHLTFGVEVPFNIISHKNSDEKPLIVYLHGFNQNIQIFREKIEPMMDIDAHHLFIGGPYPLYDRRRKRKVEQWGRAWYLYDGDPEQFVTSLEKTSQFLEETLERVKTQLKVSRIAMVGYSMGGYLAGYYALSRVQTVNELVVIGGRIKTELFSGKGKRFEHLNVLALHGANDSRVKSGTQQESTEELAGWGVDVTFKELDASHSMSTLFIDEIKSWLLSKRGSASYRERKD